MNVKTVLLDDVKEAFDLCTSSPLSLRNGRKYEIKLLRGLWVFCSKGSLSNVSQERS